MSVDWDVEKHVRLGNITLKQYRRMWFVYGIALGLCSGVCAGFFVGLALR